MTSHHRYIDEHTFFILQITEMEKTRETDLDKVDKVLEEEEILR